MVWLVGRTVTCMHACIGALRVSYRIVSAGGRGSRDFMVCGVGMLLLVKEGGKWLANTS